jgi:hypothetical protein
MAAKKRTTSTPPDNRSEAEKRDEQRKQFVAQKKAQGVSAKEANTQFYVQTRVKELTAKGVKVDTAKRQQLRQNYQSGQVKRAGFGVTPASGKPKPVTTPTTTTTPKSETKKNTSGMSSKPTVRTGRETSSYTTSRTQSVPDRMGNPARKRTGPETTSFVSAQKKKGGIFGFVSGVDRTLTATNPIYGANRDYFGRIASAASTGKSVSDSVKKGVVAKVKQDAMLAPTLLANTPALLAAKGTYETLGRLGVPLPGYKKKKK